jgi:hypothetical protein
MDVVVDMLASNDWRNGVSFLSGTFCSSVLKLRALLLKACLDGIGIAVLMLSVLDGNDVMGVLFWENFAVLDWLHGGVVMILMYLTVNCSLGFLMANFGDVLIHDGWGNLLVYGGIMVTSLVPKEVMMSDKLSTNQALDNNVRQQTTYTTVDKLRIQVLHKRLQRRCVRGLKVVSLE